MIEHVLWPAARKALISFDIDGTLELGDPPGPITLEIVRWARSRGHVIGSASDRTLREQQEMWARAGIEPDFTSGKHNLRAVRNAFTCERFIHVGDTLIDAHYAALAGFEFLSEQDLAQMFG